MAADSIIEIIDFENSLLGSAGCKITATSAIIACATLMYCLAELRLRCAPRCPWEVTITLCCEPVEQRVSGTAACRLLLSGLSG